MNRLYTYIMGLMVVIICLAACGQKQEQSAHEETFAYIEEVVEEEEDDFDRSGLTWNNTQWVNPVTVDSQKRLYIESYHSYDWVTPNAKQNGGNAYGNTFYRLVSYEQANGYQYRIECYDMAQESSSVLDLDLDQFFRENPDCVLKGLYVESETEFVTLKETLDGEKLTGLVAVHMDQKGNILKSVDLYEAFVESEICPMDDGNKSIYIEAVNAGYYYLSVYGYSPICIIDKNGTLLRVQSDASKDDKVVLMWKHETKEGNPIFWLREGKLSTWFTFEENGEYRKLAQNDNYSQHSDFALTEDGYCYLINDTWLYRWDIFTGKSIKLLNLENEGISENYLAVQLCSQDTGIPIVFLIYDDHMESYHLTYQKPDTSNYFTIVSFSNNCKELEAACADYTRTHPGNGIWVEKPSKDLDTYRTRLLAEMVAGRGPDAMYVSTADMQMFYEKGVLEDLTGYLSSDLEQQIFKGVLDCGKVDDKQVGFPLAADLTTMLVDENLWDKDTWRLQDMMELIQTGKVPNLKMLVMMNSRAWTGPRLSEGVLQALTLQDLNNSPFLNLEQGICNFDSLEFIRLLELCKQYPQTIEVGGAAAGYHDKTLLGFIGDVRNLQTYSYTMKDCDDRLRCVGFPTETGTGSYWDCDYLLVVRKGFDKKDTILDLMETLYDADNQRKVNNPVNRTVFETNLIGPFNSEDPETGEINIMYFLDQGEESFVSIPAKEDGSSWLPEFLELADKAVPLPHDADMAAQIVREEVKAYFTGNRDAESVAKIIQNRVKLWMMEQM